MLFIQRRTNVDATSSPQRVHDVYATSHQRRCNVINPAGHDVSTRSHQRRCNVMTLQDCINVDATLQRCIDVDAILYKRHVPARTHHLRCKISNAYFS